MINISDLNTFLSAVKKLGIEVTTERNSIVECIRIRQIDAKVTELTTIEPNAGVFTRLYEEEDANSFGIENTELLVNYKHLADTLTSLASGKATNCCLVVEEGKLLVYTDVKAIPGATGIGEFDINYTYTDIKTVELYLGDESDFLYPEFEEQECIGYLKADNLNLFSDILIKLGQFTGTDEKYVNTIESGGRGIEFYFTSSNLNLFALDKTRMVMLNGSINFSGEEDTDWLSYFEGRNLYRLIDLAKSSEVIDIYKLSKDGNDWIGFQSSKGLVYVRLKTEDYSVSQKHQQYHQLQELIQSTLFEFRSNITINGIELANGLTKQHSEKDKLLEKLTLMENAGNLVIFPFHKSAQKDKSLVSLEDFEGDFISTNIDFKFISTCLQSVLKYTTYKSLGPLVNITQYPYILNDLNILLLFISPLNEDSSTHLSLFCCGDYSTLDLEEELNYGQEV
jgi:hypothetical protein